VLARSEAVDSVLLNVPLLNDVLDSVLLNVPLLNDVLDTSSRDMANVSMHAWSANLTMSTNGAHRADGVMHGVDRGKSRL